MIEWLSLSIDIIKAVLSIGGKVTHWFRFTRPARKVLQDIASEKTLTRIFVKDVDVDPRAEGITSREGPTMQTHHNIEKYWPEVEAVGVAQLLNLLGRLGKKDKLEIIPMSKGYDMWDSNLIVLGGQAMKSRNFYETMEKVAYSMDDREIYDVKTGQAIERVAEHGYGLILKSENRQIRPTGVAFLLGGFGTLGTEAAVEYFIRNIDVLGKEFGDKCFGVVVRAQVSAGKQSVKRIKSLDKVFN